jgi:uncharacterized protein
MHIRSLGDHGSRTIIAICEAGDDALQSLIEVARSQEVSAASFIAVGAFSSPTLGWFDPDEKRYVPVEVTEQAELLSLVGDIAAGDDGPIVHAHAVVGLQGGHTRGGHLLAGIVRPTLEAVIREVDTPLRKIMRPEVGLALIDLDAIDDGKARA